VTENPPTAEELYTTFRERRNQAVTTPQGNLALTNTAWFYGLPGVEEQVWGVPGWWSIREGGQPGISLRAEASDGIVVDDQSVDGTVVVRAKNDENPSSIVFGEGVTGFVIVNEEGRYALRVWNAQSSDIKNFGGIDAYAYNPAWVIQATFTPIDGGRAVGVDHLKDEGKTREKIIPADISFTYEGVDYSVAAFQEGHALLMVFSDGTSGEATYSVGRFLMCAPNPDGTITLDFNRAYLPPCAFSHNFNCPMPPEANRFTFAIEAGEKNALNRDGGLLH
jgi:uncharacterized protein (DUF1684 family)